MATKFRTREGTRAPRIGAKKISSGCKTERGAASGVRITEKLHASQFYRRQRRWKREEDEESGTKKAGRGTRRKFTSKDLARSPLFPLPLDAVAGPLPRMAWHSKSGAPPKLFRTIIITCRARRNLLLNIVSGMRRLQRERRKIAMKKKKRCELGRVKFSRPSKKHGSLKTSTNILCILCVSRSRCY